MRTVEHQRGRSGIFGLSTPGNDDCETIRLDGGVGGVLVDLTGAWKRDATITLAVALGDISLVLPGRSELS